MSTFSRLLLATVSLLTFAAPASSMSLREAQEKAARSDTPSILYLGEPLNCKVDVCPVEAKAEAPTPAGSVLIDTFGMPSKMPTVLRGGENSDNPVIMAPTAVAPAGMPPAPGAPAPIAQSGGGASAPAAPTPQATAEIR